jgi:hypothetical protein
MILKIFFQKHLNCFLIYFHFIVSFLLWALAFLIFLNHQIYLIVFFEDYFFDDFFGSGSILPEN